MSPKSNLKFRTRTSQRGTRKVSWAAWASQQSQSLSNRAKFEEEVEAMRAKFLGAPVPRPPFWGGYRVSLDAVEIWQGHPHRLHDRVLDRFRRRCVLCDEAVSLKQLQPPRMEHFSLAAGLFPACARSDR